MTLKLLHFSLLTILFFGCTSRSGFDIQLPEGYVIEPTTDQYNLLTATKYDDDQPVGMIEIRYSDDWSFSTFSNETYIKEALANNSHEQTAAMIFDDFKVLRKEQSYLKGVGDCFSIMYRGDNYSNGVRVVNVVFQFIKNDQLYTLIGSAFPENFSSEHKSFLKAFDTFEL
tara:strand:+ start:2064 stop:2576 length:513 start_codon:yes stop_codon:yes gene_type:complete